LLGHDADPLGAAARLSFSGWQWNRLAVWQFDEPANERPTTLDHVFRAFRQVLRQTQVTTPLHIGFSADYQTAFFVRILTEL
jgi:hypothetical protein